MEAACQRALTLGQGVMQARLDISGAFRTVQVHPDNHIPLGMTWRGHTYMDKVLLFGLRSAPKLYNAVVDALLWIIMQNQINCIH